MPTEYIAALMGKKPGSEGTAPKNFVEVEATPYKRIQPLSEILQTVTIKLPQDKMEWMKNYRYAKAMKTGNTTFTLTEAFIDAVNALKTSSEYKVINRPDSVKEQEKKIGRKPKK